MYWFVSLTIRSLCLFSPQDRRAELGVDVELGQYVASGVVVFDLHRKVIKWSQVRVAARGGTPVTSAG